MKVGIALGGGGARGFAHIGVLEVLDYAGIDCEVVSGTSIGSLVGSVYADGNLAKLAAESAKIKLTDIPMLLSPTWSKRGLFSGKNALELLGEFVDCDLIENLKKPFAAVAVDLAKSEIVTFTEGDLKMAVRASASIPAVFTPVIDGERILIDGGTLEPVPVQAARALGADFVIAVDLFGAYPNTEDTLQTSKEGEKALSIETALSYLRSISSKMAWGETDTPNLIEIIENTLAVSQQHLTALRLRDYPADIVVQPPITDISFLDFHRGEPIIEVGRRVMQQQLPQLKEKLAQF